MFIILFPVVYTCSNLHQIATMSVCVCVYACPDFENDQKFKFKTNYFDYLIYLGIKGVGGDSWKRPAIGRPTSASFQNFVIELARNQFFLTVKQIHPATSKYFPFNAKSAEHPSH